MNVFIIPLVSHFPIYKVQENAQNKPAYYTVQSQFDQVLAEGERSKNKILWNNKPLLRCYGR